MVNNKKRKGAVQESKGLLSLFTPKQETKTKKTGKKKKKNIKLNR